MAETPQSQTLEQKRAQYALNCIHQVDALPSLAGKSKYAALARKAPATIQSNGLGQTLAFLRAKAGRDFDNEHGQLYRHVSNWVMGYVKPEAPELEKSERLLEWITQSDSPSYRRAALETQALLVWLKRFAEALLPQPDDGE